MKRIIALVGIYTIPLLVSLVLPSCDGCEGDPITWATKSITSTAREILRIDFATYSQGEYVVANINHSLPLRYDSVGIDITHDLELLALESVGQPLLSTYALSCDPGVFYDNIIEILIKSSNEYLPQFPAGSNLKDLMTIRTGYSRPGDSLDFFGNNNEVSHSNFFLTFEVPPANQGVHSFTITYVLQDGRTLTSSVSGITIKP